MKPSSILCASLAASAALAVWLIHSTAPRVDAITAPAPERRTEAPVHTGPAELKSREAKTTAFPPPSASAPAAPSVTLSSPVASDAPSSPAAGVRSTPFGASAPGPDSLPPLSTADGPPAVPGRAVDSAAPGNFIRFRGMRAAVAGSYESGKPADRALALDILPEAANESDDAAAGDLATATAQADSGDAPKAKNPNSPGENPNPASANGLTREDELFRLKWGWAAYDAAQREARKEAGK